ncbi:MAG: hypothetical protein JXA06_00500 [Bacteroidetes bacterium]|nr:hypothetical protein [Bacteroidota bacterium]
MKFFSRFLLPSMAASIFCLNVSTAQNSLYGFQNIPFGSKMENAKKLLLQKQGVKFVKQCEYNNLYFTGFSMGAYKADTCILMESPQNGKFEASDLLFYSKAELIEEMYELFYTKYGNPTINFSEESTVFYKWEFPVRGSKYSNSITLRNVSGEDYFVLSFNGSGTLSPGWLRSYSHKAKTNEKDS